MAILAIDTSGPVTGVALDYGGAVHFVARRVSESHGAAILPLIEECLATAGCPQKEVSRILCSAGPGSFTGLRIGLSAAQGLALAWGVPLTMAPTFRCAAADLRGKYGAVAVVSDARRDEYFFGLYEFAGELVREVGDIVIIPAAELPAAIERGVGAPQGGTAVLDLHEQGLAASGFSTERPAGIAGAVARAFREGVFGIVENPGESLFFSISRAEPAYLRQVSALTIAQRREGLDSKGGSR